MKLNRFVAFALIAVVTVLTLSLISMNVFAQTDEPGTPEQDEDEAIEVEGADDAAEGPDVPITGTALEQASAAALAYLGEGRVTGTEVGDEEGYYEIEVILENGQQVDVHLDENFNVLGQIND